MRIIVLGATGQIGSVIYKGLRNVHEVVGTSRKPCEGYLQFDPFQHDWSVLKKADVLVNCVGQIESTRDSSFYHVHVDLTKNILLHREQIGNPRIIQISALGASADHEVEFLRTKGIADDILLQHHATAVIRPSIVCTHRTMIVKKMLMILQLRRWLFSTVPVPRGFLHTRIQPVMPDDLLGLVLAMCFDRNVQVVHAVGPEEITFREIIQILMESSNRKLRIIEVPKAATDMLLKNFLSRVFPQLINPQQYQLLFENNTANVQIAERMLGRPLKSTREFFKREFTYAPN